MSIFWGFLVVGVILLPLIPVYFTHQRIVESQKVEYTQPENPLNNMYFIADNNIYQV